ncbi:PREDICTED: uncharacterized protein LOC105449078 [Wasmannia auropunctata]|uniref:uncharacterized protein LOC105449078 n=1 Tax=Wasmannia auropunctata TaxID=64793 RepID=UPI0005F0BF24|nr:PREDICTED: uncharacterized protein LOC105449078 [Wasmannia auropunctata]
MKDSAALEEAGLTVQQGSKPNPRLLVRGVRTDRRTTSCVIEVTPEIRNVLMKEEHIFIDYSVCRVTDYVRVTQCYKCLAFGHFANKCKLVALCGHCAGEHETKDCEDRRGRPVCGNCKRWSSGESTAHSALDSKNCPILRRRIIGKGYQLLRGDRVGKGGGGVAVFVANNLHCRIVRRSEGTFCGKPEYLLVEISPRAGCRLLLAVVYRPPHCGYLSDFFDVFSDLSASYKHAVILGDFNAFLANSYDAEQIRSFVASSSLYLIQRHIARTIKVRDFKDFNVDSFINELNACNWSEVYQTNDIDGKMELFNNFLMHCYDRHAPLKTIQHKHLPGPWLTTDIKAIMRERDLARRRWRRHKTDINYELYKTLRNRARMLVRAAKSAYYNKILDDTRESRALWKRLRHLGLIKQRSVEVRLLFPVEELNNYFSGAPNSQQVESVNKIYLGEEIYGDTKFYWSDITPRDICSAIRRNKSMAIGCDNISQKLIASALPCILPILTHLFNFCFSRGVFSSVWKLAVVCPLPKMKCPTKLADYRPISVMCAIAKAMERIAAEQITRFVEQHGFLDPYQAAYPRGHSTQSAVIGFLDNVRRAADKEGNGGYLSGLHKGVR